MEQHQPADYEIILDRQLLRQKKTFEAFAAHKQCGENEERGPTNLRCKLAQFLGVIESKF